MMKSAALSLAFLMGAKAAVTQQHTGGAQLATGLPADPRTSYTFVTNTPIPGAGPSLTTTSRDPATQYNAPGQAQFAEEKNGITAAFAVGGAYQWCGSCMNEYLDPNERCSKCKPGLIDRSFSEEFCAKELCDPYVHCAKMKSTLQFVIGQDQHPSSSNACTSSSTPANEPDATMCGTCGTNQDTAKRCGQCVAGYTNYPYCDVSTADNAADGLKWIDGNVCGYDAANTKALGTKNDAYYKLNAGTACGADICLPTEQCCSTATEGFWAVHPAKGGAPGNYMPAFTALENSFCADKSYTCCGRTTCLGKCLDAENSVCEKTEAGEYYSPAANTVVSISAGAITSSAAVAHDGREPCYGNRVKLANGTRIVPASVDPDAWCLPSETCCDGVCCKEGDECAARGNFNQLVANAWNEFPSPYKAKSKTQYRAQKSDLDMFGFDITYSNAFDPVTGSAVTPGDFAYVISKNNKYCQNAPNEISLLRMIALPVLLTFAYIVAIVLGIHSNAAAPVKIISMVLLVLCLLNAFSWLWRVSVVVAIMATLTNFAAGSKNAGTYTPLFLLLAQIVVLLFFVGVGHFNIFGMSSSTQPIRTMSHHYPFSTEYTDSNFPSKGLDGDFANCFKEFNWFIKDAQAFDHDEALGSPVYDMDLAGGGKETVRYVNQFFGYCTPAWLAFIHFVHYAMAALLFVQFAFVAKGTFESNGTVQPKAPATEE
jgi:hypothetical protein